MKLLPTLIAGLAFAVFATSGFSQTEAAKPQPKRGASTAVATKKGPQKWIGVRVTQLRETTRSHLKKYLQGLPEEAGLVVTEISNEGPAAVAGIERNDVLLRADGQPLTKVETLQEILDKRNFATTARLEIIHEGMPKTVYTLVLEKPEGEPGLAGGFRGGPGGRGGSGGRGRGPFGGGTSTLTYTDADGKEQKVTGDQVGDFFRKMREDEKLREAVSKQGFTMHIKPGPPPSQDGGGTPPPPPPNQ
ncbi:MAG: PDZ domain-containing protein [Verrucomicrobia bacterium]|nr:PDZ domain-containing protein [Verrucomicrobiota bacterium]